MKILNVTAVFRYATVPVLPLFAHVVKYETLYHIVETFTQGQSTAGIEHSLFILELVFYRIENINT